MVGSVPSVDETCSGERDGKWKNWLVLLLVLKVFEGMVCLPCMLGRLLCGMECCAVCGKDLEARFVVGRWLVLDAVVEVVVLRFVVFESEERRPEEVDRDVRREDEVEFGMAGSEYPES